MREAIEKVIAELEENAKRHMIQETKTFNAGGTGYVIDREARRAYQVAINLLKEVLSNHEREHRTKHHIPTKKET